MLNKEFSNHELNDEQLDQFTNQAAEGELSDEELDSVDGGYWGYYNYNSYASPYAYLNSYNWASTQAILSATQNFQAVANAQHNSFIEYLRS
ncbi:MAG: hypothetical protein Tsb0014_32390 [Pleurocapsa sp.]